MKIILNGNHFDLICENGIRIDGIKAFIEYPGTHYDVLRLENECWKLISSDGLTAVVTDGKFSLEFSRQRDVIFVRGEYRAEKPLSSAFKFCFLKGLTNFRYPKMYTNGYTIFNSLKINEMQAPVGGSACMKNERKESVDFAVGMTDLETCFVLGAAEYRENYAAVELCENGEAILSVPLYGRALSEGESVRSDRFVLFAESDLTTALERFSDLVGENNGGSLDAGAAHSGWCSWYYYGANISEKIILENLREIQRRNLPFEYIQIDDGWSKKRGDWQPNEKFPHGMKWLAEQIQRAGFLPGIWVAPFTAEDGSELLKDRPELFVREYGSDSLYGWNSIDFSRPEAREYLYELFHRLSHEWGYRYIKFDFVAFGLSAGRHFDATYNGIKNYRQALEIIRSAVTEDTVLLACTSPLLAPVGFTHGIRIGKDMFERWESLKEVAAQVLHRLYLNRNIRVDPDCLMLRSSKNEGKDCFRLCTRSEREIDTYIALIGISGGTVMLSDKMRLLDEKQFEKLGYLFPLNERAGRMTDLGQCSIPSVADCGERNGLRTIVFFNWEDYSETFSFSLGKPFGIYDFWEKSFLGIRSELKETVLPHSCKVFQCSLEGGIVAGACDRLIPEIDVRCDDSSAIFSDMKRGERLLCRFGNIVKTIGCEAERSEGDLYLVTALETSFTIYF